MNKKGFIFFIFILVLILALLFGFIATIIFFKGSIIEILNSLTSFLKSFGLWILLAIALLLFKSQIMQLLAVIIAFIKRILGV